MDNRIRRLARKPLTIVIGIVPENPGMASEKGNAKRNDPAYKPDRSALQDDRTLRRRASS
ncbi:hypothetical protein [Pandoraea terrigena]|uniref:hypothetical protein n=1 Tax=Pandoraea terrigena TaxID=2508292 RepID=UPI0012407C7E|nr:hypothetical protein [Pandoraea terrigena]